MELYKNHVIVLNCYQFMQSFKDLAPNIHINRFILILNTTFIVLNS